MAKVLLEGEAQTHNGKPRKPGLPRGRLGDLVRMEMAGAWTFDTVGKMSLPVESEGLDTWVTKPALTGERATPGAPASLPIINMEGMTIFGTEGCNCEVLVLVRFWELMWLTTNWVKTFPTGGSVTVQKNKIKEQVKSATYSISQKWVHPSHFCKYFIITFHVTTLKKWHFATM